MHQCGCSRSSLDCQWDDSHSSEECYLRESVLYHLYLFSKINNLNKIQILAANKLLWRASVMKRKSWRLAKQLVTLKYLIKCLIFQFDPSEDSSNEESCGKAMYFVPKDDPTPVWYLHCWNWSNYSNNHLKLCRLKYALWHATRLMEDGKEKWEMGKKKIYPKEATFTVWRVSD